MSGLTSLNLDGNQLVALPRAVFASITAHSFWVQIYNNPLVCAPQRVNGYAYALPLCPSEVGLSLNACMRL
jgi:hypothetical protein